MRLLIAMAAVALPLLAAPAATSAPILTFEYFGSGQVVSPTGQVTVGGRITNIGDTALVNATYSGSFLIPQPAYDQYSWIQGAFPKIGPSPILSLDAGASIDWTVTILGTWPITGKRGDPVPVGDYFLTPETIKITYAELNPVTFSYDIKYPVAPAPSNFTWRVVADAPAAVPEPASLTLLAGALGLLAANRRLRSRTKCKPPRLTGSTAALACQPV